MKYRGEGEEGEIHGIVPRGTLGLRIPRKSVPRNLRGPSSRASGARRFKMFHVEHSATAFVLLLFILSPKDTTISLHSGITAGPVFHRADFCAACGIPPHAGGSRPWSLTSYEESWSARPGGFHSLSGFSTGANSTPRFDLPFSLECHGEDCRDRESEGWGG